MATEKNKTTRKTALQQAEQEFTENVAKKLGNYVYALAYPNGKIFYVGRGKGARVFQHAKAALRTKQASKKLKTIREIIKQGQRVKYYILRHGLSDAEYKKIETLVIELLTYKDFNTTSMAELTNIQKNDKKDQIMTPLEIRAKYAKEAKIKKEDGLIVAFKLTTYYKNDETVYQAVKGTWEMSQKTDFKSIKYVLVVHDGSVRGIFIPKKWTEVKGENGRYGFTKADIHSLPIERQLAYADFVSRVLEKHIVFKKNPEAKKESSNPVMYINDDDKPITKKRKTSK